MNAPTPSQLVLDGCKEFSGFLQASRWNQLLVSNPTNKPVGETVQAMISRYTVAFAAEFQSWLGVTHAFVRHELAKHTTMDNLRCEFNNDHTSMLHNFATSCDACLDRTAHAAIEPWIRDVRALFTHSATRGIYGLTVLAMLERASLTFIPVLKAAGEVCGCEDFTYTDEADLAHVNAFLEALDAESKEGYSDVQLSVQHVIRKVINLLNHIFADE